MSERILTLAASYFPRDCDGYIHATPESIVEFAELIVRECAELVDRAISDGGVDGRMVKEHFGVQDA